MVKHLKIGIVSFIVLYLTSFLTSEELLESRYLKASCNTSDIGTCKDLLCNVTSFGAMNIGFTFTRELKTVDVEILAYMKINGVFQRIAKHPSFNWCGFVRKSKINPFNRVLLNYLKNLAPKLTTPCPYVGKYYFYNLTIGEYYSMFPRGFYKLTYQVSDAIDKNILRLTYYSYLNTTVRFDGK